MTERTVENGLRIALVTEWFPPEPSVLPADIARGLAERGHHVKVLTTVPNYPSGIVPEDYQGGRRRREVVDGLDVHRVPSFPSHDSSGARRALTYLSFAASAAWRPGPASHADVTFVYGTPLTASAPALAARALNGTPFVLQVQDLWPESVIGSGMVRGTALSSAAGALISSAASAVYRSAASVIGITADMTAELVHRGADPATAATVHNWSTASPSAAPDPSIGTDGTGPLRMLYAGNIGAMQDLETVVRAVAIAERTCDLDVTIVGDGVRSAAVRELAGSLGVTSIRFHPRVSATEIDDFYAHTDFSLVTLADRPVFRLNLPSKFQASLARGLPVITTVAGAASTICTDHGCGFTALPEDPDSLAAALVAASRSTPDARARMRRAAVSLAGTMFDRDTGLDQIEAALEASSTRRRND